MTEICLHNHFSYRIIIYNQNVIIQNSSAACLADNKRITPRQLESLCGVIDLLDLRSANFCFNSSLCFNLCFNLPSQLRLEFVLRLCPPSASPQQGGSPDEDEEEKANDDEEPGGDGDEGKLRVQAVDGEQVEEEDDVGWHPSQVDVEETCCLFCLLQGAADDKEVGPGKEEAREEEIFFRGNLVSSQVILHTVNPQEARNCEEDGQVDDKDNAQEEEGVEFDNDDGQGDRPDVEEPAGEEDGKESTEVLDKLNLGLHRLLQFLATCCGLLLLLLCVVEGEQFCTDFDHHQETHLEECK